MSVLPPAGPPLLPESAAPEEVRYPEIEPSYDDLVTEDHKPVESIFIEKLYRLLTMPLYLNWSGPGLGRSFLVLANVGWFYKERTPALVPDCLLSLDVTCPENLHVKRGHSYFSWQMGKPPDVIIEFVSDKRGGEDSYKRDMYARQHVPYYAIYDPDHHLSQETLRTFELTGRVYRPVSPGPWSDIGLGLRLWEGKVEGHWDTWLRWCDTDGVVIPTAEESQAILAERAREAEEQARVAAERVRLLKEEFRRLKGEQPPT